MKKRYICIRCNLDFKNNRSHLEKHFNRKTLCNPTNCFYYDYDYLLDVLNNGNYIDFYNKNINKIQCKHCLKLYAKTSLSKHNKICKNNPENCNSNIIIKKTNQLNGQINIHIQNNIQNNIQINVNEFNKEDLSKIDFDKLTFYEKDDFYKKSFQDKANNHINNYLSILSDIISEPQNKNFKLLNKKEKKFIIKNEENKNEITHLDNVKDHFYDIVNDSYKDYVTDIKHYQRFLKLIDIEINEYEKGSKEFESQQYYKFIKKLKKIIKDKILWTAEEDKCSKI